MRLVFQNEGSSLDPAAFAGGGSIYWKWNPRLSRQPRAASRRACRPIQSSWREVPQRQTGLHGTMRGGLRHHRFCRPLAAQVSVRLCFEPRVAGVLLTEKDASPDC